MVQDQQGFPTLQNHQRHGWGQQRCREYVGPVNQSPKVGGEKGASGWGEMKKPWEEQLWGGGHAGIRALRDASIECFVLDPAMLLPKRLRGQA